MPAEMQNTHCPQTSERFRVDGEKTNDSGLGVSRQSSNASKLIVPNRTAPRSERGEFIHSYNSVDNICDNIKRNRRKTDASKCASQLTTSQPHTHDKRVKATVKDSCSNFNVSLIGKHPNRIETGVGESVKRNGTTSNRECKNSPDLHTLHEIVNDENIGKTRSFKQLRNPCCNELVQPLLPTCSINPVSPVSSDKASYTSPAHTTTKHTSHRKNKSCELKLDNELSTKCSDRRRCYSEGPVESAHILNSNGQHSVIYELQTICSDCVVPLPAIDSIQQADFETFSECHFESNSVDEDIDSFETFRIDGSNIADNKRIVERDDIDSVQFRTLELSMQSTPLAQLSPTITTTGEEQDTRMSELHLSRCNGDLEELTKHSTTINLDQDNFKTDEETLPLIDNGDGVNKKFEKSKKSQCCNVCSDRYFELHNRIDGITHDYQWAVKSLEAMLSTTGNLKMLKGRAIKVGVVAISIMLFLVCGTAATSVAKEAFFVNGVSNQEFDKTTHIADLQEQYQSVSDMVNDLMTRSKSVIHLTNGGQMTKHDGSYFVRWVANENHGQGSLALSETGDSILAPAGGYYRVCAKIYYKATVENVASVKLEYDLVRSSGGYHEHVRHAVREFPAASGSLQYELQLDTTMYVYPQDAILVSVRPDQIKYLANYDSAHEISMLEVG